MVTSVFIYHVFVVRMFMISSASCFEIDSTVVLATLTPLVMVR